MVMTAVGPIPADLPLADSPPPREDARAARTYACRVAGRPSAARRLWRTSARLLDDGGAGSDLGEGPRLLLSVLPGHLPLQPEGTGKEDAANTNGQHRPDGNNVRQL